MESNKNTNKENKPVKYRESVMQEHRSIIDEYYINGFQGLRAVQSVHPGKSYTAAAAQWHNIQRLPHNVAYIDKKRKALAKKTEIKNEHVLKELINWFYVDATDFIGLTIDEIKELPHDVRRCIQSFKHVKRSYTSRDGTDHVQENIEVKLINKDKAADLISKHIGFFEMDNKQKANRINLTKIDNLTLNALVQAIENE